MRVLTLEFGIYEATIIPALGASIGSFRCNGIDVLRDSENNGALPLAAAHFPCVPYFGRLYDGLHFSGRDWTALAPTLTDASDLPLHGHGWVSNWEVTSNKKEAVLLQHDFIPSKQGDFPFAYHAYQKISLDRAGLTIELTVKNSGTSPMPAGLGLHPFFNRSPETQVQFTATNFWFPPIEGSGGLLGPLPTRLGTSLSAPLGKRTLDHSFAGFTGDLVITNKEQIVRLSSDAPILHIYAPEGADFFCAEPVSHLPGRFTEEKGTFCGETIAPGETTSLTMTVSAID